MYQEPEALATTSPHQRIIERFRRERGPVTAAAADQVEPPKGLVLEDSEEDVASVSGVSTTSSASVRNSRLVVGW